MTSLAPVAKRVAFVSDWYLPRFGGLEVYLDGLARRLTEAGTAVEVFTPLPGPAQHAGIRVHRLCGADPVTGGYRFPPAPTASNAKDLLYLLNLLGFPPAEPALRQLHQGLKAGDFDAVHVHLGNTPFAYLAVAVAIKLGLPTVVTFHSMLMPLEAGIARCVAPLLRSTRWQEHAVLTAVSSAVAQGRQGMLGGAEVGLLANATEKALWEPVRRQRLSRMLLPGRDLQLVATMRLHPRKRPWALLELARKALLARDAATGALRLHVAGDGPLRESLQDRIAAWGLSDYVVLHGRLSPEGLKTLYAQADLFVAPTRLEAFGLAALEARLAGVPILGMAGSGLEDFVTDGQDGILAKSDVRMQEALAAYLCDPGLQAQLATGATLPLAGFGWTDAVSACRRAYRAANARARQYL